MRIPERSFAREKQVPHHWHAAAEFLILCYIKLYHIVILYEYILIYSLMLYYTLLYFFYIIQSFI